MALKPFREKCCERLADEAPGPYLQGMNRRHFLAAATAAGLAPFLPLPAARPAAGGFWARYLSGLHGAPSATHVARFAVRPVRPASVAVAARPVREAWLEKAARRLLERAAESTEDVRDTA